MVGKKRKWRIWRKYKTTTRWLRSYSKGFWYNIHILYSELSTTKQCMFDSLGQKRRWVPSLYTQFFKSLARYLSPNFRRRRNSTKGRRKGHAQENINQRCQLFNYKKNRKKNQYLIYSSNFIYIFNGDR